MRGLFSENFEMKRTLLNPFTDEVVTFYSPRKYTTTNPLEKKEEKSSPNHSISENQSNENPKPPSKSPFNPKQNKTTKKKNPPQKKKTPIP